MSEVTHRCILRHQSEYHPYTKEIFSLFIISISLLIKLVVGQESYQVVTSSVS